MKKKSNGTEIPDTKTYDNLSLACSLFPEIPESAVPFRVFARMENAQRRLGYRA